MKTIANIKEYRKKSNYENNCIYRIEYEKKSNFENNCKYQRSSDQRLLCWTGEPEEVNRHLHHKPIILFLFYIIIFIIIITRPKPAYGRQGPAGLWGQDIDQVGSFWGVLNVSLRACSAQLGFKPTWDH